MQLGLWPLESGFLSLHIHISVHAGWEFVLLLLFSFVVVAKSCSFAWLSCKNLVFLENVFFFMLERKG